MAGIYVHIPFCKQACHYCNFHFSTSLKYYNEFIQALLQEIALRAQPSLVINTIYFGGGTPGLLQIADVEKIIKALQQHFSIKMVKEFTIEMNPDDVDEEKLKALKSLGVDRISLGVQSFFEQDLQYMHRSHSAEKAKESIALIAQNFNNYSVDLIYGFPLLTNDKLKNNVDFLVQNKTPHISAYALTVEEKTALHRFIETKKVAPLQSEQQAQQFLWLMEYLAQHAYNHYEISSYALANKEAIHNSNYWNGENYFGFGPSAHSFDGQTRSWNVANNALYIKALQTHNNFQTKEILTRENKTNEYIMISLRTRKGFSLDKIKNDLSEKEYEYMMKKIEKYMDIKCLLKEEQNYRLSNEGKLFADKISSELFI